MTRFYPNNRKELVRYRGRNIVAIMRKFFVSAVIIFSVSSVYSMGPVSDENNIEIPVDNEYVQTYKGVKGLWFVPGKDTPSSAAKKFGVTMEDVYAANGGKPAPGAPFFIPMSEEYYTTLLAKGNGRRIYTMDKRKMLWPVEDPIYSSRYGRRWNAMHNGLDMPVPHNTVVVASADGVVYKSGPMGDYGRAVVIRHDDGLETWYAHNNTTLVKEGERVTRGQIIAYSGNTGRSTGPHVHFEVRYMNVAMNPEDFLQFGLTEAGKIQKEALEDSLTVSDDGSLTIIGRGVSVSPEFQP